MYKGGKRIKKKRKGKERNRIYMTFVKQMCYT